MLYVVFCSGIKRSASTWSYNVCRHITSLKALALNGKSFAQYSSDTDFTLNEIEKNIAANEPNVKNMDIIGVIKAHELGPHSKQLLSQNLVSNIYTIRDPRDCIASMEKFWPRTDGKTFDDRIRAFQRWLIDGDAFAEDKHSLIIRYEDMQKDAMAQIARIAKHLNVNCNEKVLKEIFDATSVEASQRHIDQIVKEKTVSERVYCRVTQLHENHLGGGQVGRWRDELSLENQAKVECAFYPWLVKFGYDMTA
jgi:hypothetical protein